MGLQYRTFVVVLAATALLGAGCGTDGGTRQGPTSAPTPSVTVSTAGPSTGATATPSDPPASPSTAAPGSPASSAPAGTARPATAPWCTTGALKASVRPLQPGAGQRYAALVLTNTSGTACRTRGYVGMQLMTAGGRKVPTDVVRDGSGSPVLVRLAPGGSAWSELHWTVVATGDEPTTGDCRPAAATARITPPDQYSGVSARWGLGPVCAGGRIDATPLAAGTGPSS
jgi:hypothetical protein